MSGGGQNLRLLREQLGLTMRDVENASSRIAERHGNDEYFIPPSRLSDIETKGVTPSIFRLYSLAVIYRKDLRELLSGFGVDLNAMATDLDILLPPKSHVSDALANLSSVRVPVRIDPGFDPRMALLSRRRVRETPLKGGLRKNAVGAAGPCDRP